MGGLDGSVLISGMTACCIFVCKFTRQFGVFYRLEADKIRIVRVLGEHQDFCFQLFGASSDSGEND